MMVREWIVYPTAHDSFAIIEEDGSEDGRLIGTLSDRGDADLVVASVNARPRVQALESAVRAFLISGRLEPQFDDSDDVDFIAPEEDYNLMQAALDAHTQIGG